MAFFTYLLIPCNPKYVKCQLSDNVNSQKGKKKIPNALLSLRHPLPSAPRLLQQASSPQVSYALIEQDPEAESTVK